MIGIKYLLNKYSKTVDAVIIILLILLSLISAHNFLSRANIIPSFYQNSFGPAVLLSCQNHFSNIDTSKIPSLDNFLLKKSPAFSCKDIPKTVKTTPLNSFHKVHKYLLYSASLSWNILGISWESLTFLSYLFLGITIIFSYLLFRLGMGRTLSIACTLILTSMPFHFSHMPHLRDYSKTPFLISLIYLSSLIVIKNYKLLNFILLTSLSGLIMGFGIGFRMDILIMLPFFIFIILFFSPYNYTKQYFYFLFGIGAFLISFLISGFPILRAIGSGGNTFHVILLGLTSYFDQNMGIQQSIYEWFYHYNDGHISAIVNSYYYKVSNIPLILRNDTVGYDHACFKYYIDLLLLFPADIFTRYIAAIIKIIEIPPNFGGHTSLIISLASLLFISLISIRYSLYIMLSVFYLSGYPSLQFAERHYFYLQFIPLWLTGFLAKYIIVLFSSIYTNHLHDNIYRYLSFKSLLKQFLIIFILLIIIIVPLYSLRFYQQRILMSYIQTIEVAETEEMGFNPISQSNSNILFSFDTNELRNPNYQGPDGIFYQYLIAEFDNSKCNNDVVDITIKYHASDIFADYSRNINLLINKPLRYVFPVFSAIDHIPAYLRGSTHFSGIEIPLSQAPCLVSLKRIKKINQFTLMPALMLFPGWENSPLYQDISLK